MVGPSNDVEKDVKAFLESDRILALSGEGHRFSPVGLGDFPIANRQITESCRQPCERDMIRRIRPSERLLEDEIRILGNSRGPFRNIAEPHGRACESLRRLDGPRNTDGLFEGSDSTGAISRQAMGLTEGQQRLDAAPGIHGFEVFEGRDRLFVVSGRLFPREQSFSLACRLDGKIEGALRIADCDRLMMVMGEFGEHRFERTGMLFIYEGEDRRSMWMKNTYISLDMVFARADGTVTNVITNTIPHLLVSNISTEPAQYVLELNAGTAHRLGIGRDSRLLWEPDDR